MSTFNLKHQEVLKLSKEYFGLNNKDFYIQYLLNRCETESEKETIKKIVWNSMQNNSVIRIRNYFIKNWLADKTDKIECKRKYEDIKKELKQDTRWLFDWLKRFFKQF